MNRERIKEEFRIAYRLGLENKSFDIDSAMLHIDPFVVKYTTQQELLEKLEWSGIDQTGFRYCPDCKRFRESGHDPECRLLKGIKGNK